MQQYSLSYLLIKDSVTNFERESCCYTDRYVHSTLCTCYFFAKQKLHRFCLNPMPTTHALYVVKADWSYIQNFIQHCISFFFRLLGMRPFPGACLFKCFLKRLHYNNPKTVISELIKDFCSAGKLATPSAESCYFSEYLGCTCLVLSSYVLV